MQTPDNENLTTVGFTDPRLTDPLIKNTMCTLLIQEIEENAASLGIEVKRRPWTVCPMDKDRPHLEAWVVPFPPRNCWSIMLWIEDEEWSKQTKGIFGPRAGIVGFKTKDDALEFVQEQFLRLHAIVDENLSDMKRSA